MPTAHSLLNRSMANPSASVQIKGATGQDCTKACTAAGERCDEALMRQVNSEETFKSKVRKEQVCKLPILKTCGSWLPRSLKASEDFCYYQGSDYKKTVGRSANKSGSNRLCGYTGVSAGFNKDITWAEEAQVAPGAVAAIESWDEQDTWSEQADPSNSSPHP